MISQLSITNVHEEIMRSEKPVLIACLHETEQRRHIITVLEQIAAAFYGRIKICILDVKQQPLLSEEFTVNGTPTFILFHRTERSRKIGMADRPSLESFIVQNGV